MTTYDPYGSMFGDPTLQSFIDENQNVPQLDEDGIARAGEPLSAGAEIAGIDAIADALRTVYDPEIPVNIYELGLVYKVNIDDGGGDGSGDVHIAMTLTAPGCPVAGILPGQVAMRVADLDGVGKVSVELTWDPPWDPSMMSEAARVELNMF